MRGSLLQIFRSADGRSIARALACLLVFNLFVAGLHTGAMAAVAGPDPVLCSVPTSASDEVPRPAARDHLTSCCLAMNAGAALVPDAPTVAVPATRGDRIVTVPDEHRAGSFHFQFQPRGPPSST